MSFERSDEEAAYRHFVEVGGREEIRSLIKRVMAPVPTMEFPVEWHVIEGSRVVFYPWQVFPDPKGGSETYRFGCVTILEYAGDGLFSHQEDVYNPNEAAEVVERWRAAGGTFAAPAGVLGT